MNRIVLCALALSTAVYSAAVEPTVRINRCQTVAEIEACLRDLAKRPEPGSDRALLWGSILYQGVKPKEARFPKDVFDAGERLVSQGSESPSRKALDVWWEQAIGRPRRLPDMKHLTIIKWVEVTGSSERIPIYGDPSDDKAAATLHQKVESLMRDASPVDTLQVYRIWNDKTGTLVPDSTVQALASDQRSPFYSFMVAEMALREKKAGKAGPYTERWRKLSSADPNSIVIRCLLQREKEQLAKRS